MKLAGYLGQGIGAAATMRTEIFLPQSERQPAKGMFAVSADLRHFYGARAGIAGVNIDVCPPKPTRFFESHSDGEGLATSGAGRTPDIQCIRRVSHEIFGNDLIHESANLLHLTPEVRLLNGQRIEDFQPFESRY